MRRASAVAVFLVVVGGLTRFILFDSGHADAQEWKGDYRHKHHKAVEAAAKGDFKAVVAWCNETLKKHPNDAETLYFLALAQAQLGESADAAVAAALKAGLEPGRFLAGPRAWTEAVAKHPSLAKARGIIHGPMLGNLRPDAVSIWVRTSNKAEVQAVAGALKSAKVATDASTDYTTVLELTGLKPSTKVTYDVLIDGASHFGAAKPSFTTPPAAGSKVKFSLGFGGGAAYKPELEGIWKVITAHHPDLFLFMGDNVYIDQPTEPHYQRYLYYRRQSVPIFRDMISRTAIYSVWDDHDFGKNDCGGGPAIDTPAWKIPVWEVYKQNWVNPAYGGGRKAPGIWYDFRIGDVHFIMLDGRYYRTKGKTMLGPVQKQWLLDTLGASKATFTFLCSPVPWIGGNSDKWEGFPEERKEILDFIGKHRIPGVIIISADRHRSDVLVTHRPDAYDIPEFMSSKLTNVHTHGTIGENQGAIFSYNKGRMFGLVEIDTTKADPEVVYTIIDHDDKTIHVHKVLRSTLQ